MHFFKGGKAQFVDGHAYLLPLPSRGGRAFDNFCGSCVVSFWYLARGYRVVIGDTNARLIRCLRNLRERPEAIIETLAAEASAYTDAKDQREDFYTRRGHLNRLAPESLEASALFLFVLRAGFNGLWRENSKGECNTTWGDPLNVDKSGKRQHVRGKDLVRADELRTIARLLDRADIRLGDFEETSADIRKSDVAFADCPYAGTFVGYSKGGWTLKDRQRLGAWLRRLDKRGVRWTATDTASDHALATYGLWHVERVQVRRSGSCKAEGRGLVTACVVSNWTPERKQAA